MTHETAVAAAAADDAAPTIAAADAAAKVACVALASVFAGTMVAFTLLRVAGLKRVLVPRSGVIGVGVAWTIVSMTLTGLYASHPAQLAPCTPRHALVVNVPQQAVFLLSLHARRLVTTAGALRLLLTFLVGVGCLNLAQSMSRTGVDGGEDEMATGAVKSDGTAEEVNVTEARLERRGALAHPSISIRRLIPTPTPKCPTSRAMPTSRSCIRLMRVKAASAEILCVYVYVCKHVCKHVSTHVSTRVSTHVHVTVRRWWRRR